MIDTIPATVQIELGDMLGYSSPKFIGRMVRKFTRGYREAPSVLSHVGVFVNEGAIKNVNLAEALFPKGVVCRRFAEAYTDLENCYLIKPLNITQDQRLEISKYVINQVNKPYGTAKVLAHGADGVAAWICRKKDVFFFRKIFRSDRFPMCSFLGAHAYRQAGLDFGQKDDYLNPDEIWDYALDHPKRYGVWRLANTPA